MKRWWLPKSIRVRLSAWYGATLLVILIVYGIGSFVFVRGSLSQELDRRLQGDFEVAETMLDRGPRGEVVWLGPLHEHEEAEVGHQIWVEAWSPGGDVEYRSELPDWLAGALGPPAGTEAVLRRRTLPNGRRVRALEGGFPTGGVPTNLRVIRSEEPMHQTIGRLMRIGFLGIPLAVILAGTAGCWMASRFLKPVSVMAGQAASITADRLHERLPVRNPADELGRLAGVFNATFARLERSFDQLRQFTSDASHELRTPLTSLRSVGEVALQEPRDAETYRETISSMLEEVERLTHLVDSLLTLSRADAGSIELRHQPLDLAAFAGEVVDDLSVLAEEKGQSLVLETPRECQIVGDPNVLRFALVNLVHNAIRHCPESSSIRVVLGEKPGAATVAVIDNGPGIADADRDRVFERFYRVGTSRSRSEGGTGLGLAIACWAVEAHHGTIELEVGDGRGCVFTVELPRARLDASSATA